MKPILTLNRFNVGLFLGGNMAILLITIIFNYSAITVGSALLTAIVPFIILLAISTFFFFERIFVYKTYIEYRSIFSRKKVLYKDISSIHFKKVRSSGGSEGVVRFYMIFKNDLGKEIGQLPLGFFKKQKNRRKFLELVLNQYPSIKIDQDIMRYGKEGLGSKVFTVLLFFMYLSMMAILFWMIIQQT